MADKILTLQEIETRRQQLAEESKADKIALIMGLMAKSEVVERAVRRDAEQRWLEMESFLLRSSKTTILH
jgi:hypothetical protein